MTLSEATVFIPPCYRATGMAARDKRTGITLLTQPNQRWAIDFMHDALVSGHAIRVFTVVDLSTPEYVA